MGQAQRHAHARRGKGKGKGVCVCVWQRKATCQSVLSPPAGRMRREVAGGKEYKGRSTQRTNQTPFLLPSFVKYNAAQRAHATSLLLQQSSCPPPTAWSPWHHATRSLSLSCHVQGKRRLQRMWWWHKKGKQGVAAVSSSGGMVPSNPTTTSHNLNLNLSTATRG